VNYEKLYVQQKTIDERKSDLQKSKLVAEDEYYVHLCCETVALVVHEVVEQ